MQSQSISCKWFCWQRTPRHQTLLKIKMFISVFKTQEYGKALEIIYCAWKLFFSPLSSSLRVAGNALLAGTPWVFIDSMSAAAHHLQRLLEHEQRSRSDVAKIQIEKTSKGATPCLCDQHHQKFFKVSPCMSYDKKINVLSSDELQMSNFFPTLL